MNKVLNFLLTIVFAVVGLPVILLLIFFTFFNTMGLLFGFEKPSPACDNYANNETTRFERFMFPITGYACQKDAGLLQPYATNFIKYLNEVPNDETK